MQYPQPTQWPSSMTAVPSTTCTPSLAQWSTHMPQPMHLPPSMRGVPLLCISILPFLEPQPMPMFLSAPPNPALTCPLKWVSETMISASATAAPILASLTYSPPTTGISRSSVPRRPSAMIVWTPVDSGL